MAVKALKSLVVILTVVFLLFGCGGSDQTASNQAKRSDAPAGGTSTVSAGDAGSNAGNGGENQDPAGDRPSAADVQSEDQQEDKQAAPGSGALSSGNKALPEPEGERKDGSTQDSREPAQAALPAKEGAAATAAASGGNGTVAPEGNKPVAVKFSEMYAGSSSRGLQFSDKLKSLSGKKVVMTGYMAPPLKPSLTFFVLTREPLALCPFCSSDASWPEDIVLTYLPKGKDMTPTQSLLRVTGTLELGSRTDPETGFVSQARIYADKIEPVQ
jgi:hypothetical protein